MYRQGIAAVWRVLFAFGVTYIFTIVLLTASAQQQVIAALTEVDPKLDYSTAYVRDRELHENRVKADNLTKDEQRLLRSHEAAERGYSEDLSRFNEAWGDVSRLADSLSLTGKCDPRPGSEPLPTWSWYVACVNSPELSAAEKRRFSGPLSLTPAIPELYRAQRSRADNVMGIERGLARTRTDITAAHAVVKDGEALRGAFDEMDALRTGWLLAGGIFIHFPPLLLQILLALAAGSFGALLLTIVLSVYPSTAIKFTSGQGFELRVLLGGLIAVGVYVVLSGGVSVLGSSSALGDGPINVMTFCAVGILAGMFSDRVAFWLSEKADVFFATEQPKPPTV